MMEAARTSETLVNFYQTTRRYNPEDSHLHRLRVFESRALASIFMAEDGTLKMEAVGPCPSELLVPTYKFTRGHNPEDQRPHFHRCQNVRSQ
jgi:hypothetical protein